MKKVTSITIGLVILILCSCSSTSIREKQLTKVVVPRKVVQTKDTILSRMGIELERVDSIVEAETAKRVYVKDLTGYDSIAPKQEQKVEPVKPEQPEPVLPKQQNVLQEGNYHVIVASFPNESLKEAEKYTERLKKEAPGAKLIVTESRVRVAYSSHSTMAIATDARDTLAASSSKYKDCWVLKRVL